MDANTLPKSPVLTRDTYTQTSPDGVHVAGALARWPQWLRGTSLSIDWGIAGWAYTSRSPKGKLAAPRVGPIAPCIQHILLC